jgi:hypothetical protein
VIYATPYDPHTKQCTAPSTDSGFRNLDAVVAAMGPPLTRSPQTAGYPGVIFSRIVWSSDSAS